jgi:TRAP-type C4-dicarboxylate transport system substrate-binding protein
MISATGWWDVLKYITISKHIYQPAVIVINKDFWDRLPEDIQKAVEKAMVDAQPKIRKALADFEPELIEAYKEKGNVVYFMTPEERNLFKEKTKNVEKEFANKFGEVLTLIKNAQKEFRQKHKK